MHYRTVHLAFLLAFTLLISYCGQPSEPTLTQEEATELLLAKLMLSDTGGTTLIRVAPRPLAVGDTISELFSEEEPYVVAKEQWFYFIDQQEGVFFSHPTRFAYVDRATKAIHLTDHTNIPLLNGEPIWTPEPGIPDTAGIVFSNSLKGELEGDLFFADEEVPLEFPIAEEPMEHEECCPEPRPRFALILYNFDKGPLRSDISDNVAGMSSALRANGYTVPNFPSSTGSGGNQPAIYLGDKRGRGLQQLRDFVAEHDDEEDCCEEIIIYYTGHGQTKRVNGTDRYFFGTRFSYRGEDNDPDRRRQKRLYAEDFAQILSGLASCHIHIFIDACHSGGFIDPLFTIPGVETVRVSCQADEKAYSGRYDAANNGRTPDPYGKAQGEKGSEFTSGFVKGLNEQAQSRPAGSPPTPVRELIDIGFLEALENDISAIGGKTHPTGITRIDHSGCDCCEEEER